MGAGGGKKKENKRNDRLYEGLFDDRTNERTTSSINVMMDDLHERSVVEQTHTYKRVFFVRNNQRKNF